MTKLFFAEDLGYNYLQVSTIKNLSMLIMASTLSCAPRETVSQKTDRVLKQECCSLNDLMALQKSIKVFLASGIRTQELQDKLKKDLERIKEKAEQIEQTKEAKYLENHMNEKEKEMPKKSQDFDFKEIKNALRTPIRGKKVQDIIECVHKYRQHFPCLGKIHIPSSDVYMLDIQKIFKQSLKVVEGLSRKTFTP